MKRIYSVLEGFLSIDLRTLAFVRFLTGIVIIIDLISRSQDLVAHYTDLGVIPRSMLLSGTNQWTFSAHVMGGSVEFMAFMFVLAGLFAFLLSMGYRTRLMTVLSWVMVMSIQNRNPLICYGGDSVLRMLLFWGMFVPWGAKYSIDSIRYGFNRLTDHLPTKVFTIGTVGMTLQVLYIYLFTALFKNGPEWHSEGTAVYFAIAIDELASRFNYLLRALPMDVLKGMTWSVLAWEWIGPLIVAWPHWKVRIIGLMGFFMLQLGFYTFMELGLFPVFSTLAILIFIPSEVWDRLEQRLVTARMRSLRIYYDPECGFCQRMVIAINRFLLFDAAQLIAASEQPELYAQLREHNSWVIQDGQGKLYFKGWAMATVLAHSPLLWPLAFVFRWAAPITDRLYGLIAARRPEMASFSYFPQGITSRYSITPGIPAIVLATWCLLYITLYNFHKYDETALPVPKSLHWVSGLFKVDQNWAMFAPAPYKGDGWYVIPAQLMNGDTVDLFKDGQPVSYDKPERVAATYSNTRWSKYLRTVRKTQYKNALRHYVRWVWRDWDKRHPQDQQLKRFEVIFMLETNKENWETAPVRKVVLWTQDCRIN
jgi:predicted DCC family thiol-disulfide oxidoreductase YuxK